MSRRFRTIGVIGGMGPAATVDFMAKLLSASGAISDQDHPRILVDCDPTIPERHAAIRDQGPSPAPRLIAMARGLAAAGAELLTMPCNTAHTWAAEIRAATPLPFISIIDATVAETRSVAPQARHVGLLAAQGCLDADLYGPAFSDRGVEAFAPDAAAQATFMNILWRIKSGDTGSDARAAMRVLSLQLVEDGAQAIVAACTEVSLALAAEDLPVPLIDSAAALAKATIEAARC